MKCYKKVFFITILVMLLLGVSIVSATNDTTTDSTASDVSHIEHTNVQKDTNVVKDTSKEKLKTRNENNNEEKQIVKENKTDKNLKEDSITINGITYSDYMYNKNIRSEEIEDSTFFNDCNFTRNKANYELYESCYINNSRVINKGELYFYTMGIVNNSNVFAVCFSSDNNYVENCQIDSLSVYVGV